MGRIGSISLTGFDASTPFIQGTLPEGIEIREGREEVGESARNSVEHSIYPENTREPGRHHTVYIKSKLVNFDGRFHKGCLQEKNNNNRLNDVPLSFVDNFISIK